MNINEITIGQLKQLKSLLGERTADVPDTLMEDYMGRGVIIRTVTMIYVGVLGSISATDVGLSDAAWVADSGRWHDALKTGKLSEVEPYPDGCVVMRGAIVDVAPWPHRLPLEQK